MLDADFPAFIKISYLLLQSKFTNRLALLGRADILIRREMV